MFFKNLKRKILSVNSINSLYLKNTSNIVNSRNNFWKFNSTLTSAMTDLNFNPPENVNGMKVLDRSAFKKTVAVPFIQLKWEEKKSSVLINKLKKYSLAVFGIKALQNVDTYRKRMLLNPLVIKKYSDFDSSLCDLLKKHNVAEDDFGETVLELTYENWKADAILKAVLPRNEPILRSFSIIGHIIHLNLKDHLLEYKHLIAEVLLDKISCARTVVYKTNAIENVYRNFQMELLCGEPNYMVSTVEYGAKFEFDFSKVYWNPRLSQEHDRVINILNPGDALFDLFAGVGPFSIRAALKKCLVFANDLNPESYKWLNHSIKLNKKSVNYITTYNKDAADFILEEVKENLLKLLNDKYFTGRIHFVMNLPATALQFLRYFKGLFLREELSQDQAENFTLMFHCYFFVKEPETVAEVFQRDSQIAFDETKHKFYFVRNVSNGKGMHRVTFEMPVNDLLKENTITGEPSPKRICF